MGEETKPRIPEVGEYVRMFGTLVEIQDVTPKPPPVPVLDYIFENTTARVEVLANGRLLTDGPTMTNFCGKDTCVEAAINEAKKQAAAYGDGVEVRVVKVTSRVRMRPTDRKHLYAREFAHFQYLDHGCGWGLPEPVEEVVWSSKSGEAVQ